MYAGIYNGVFSRYRIYHYNTQHRRERRREGGKGGGGSGFASRQTGSNILWSNRPLPPPPWEVLLTSMCVGGLVDCSAGGRNDLVSRRRRPHACNEPIPSESRFTEPDRPPASFDMSSTPESAPSLGLLVCPALLIVNNLYHRVANDLFTRVHQRTDFYGYLSYFCLAMRPVSVLSWRSGAGPPAVMPTLFLLRPCRYARLRWWRIGLLELGLRSTCERSVSCDRLV